MSQYPYKYLTISAVIFALDQITKYVIRTYYKYCEIDVWRSFFRITHVQNPAAAFSLSIGSAVTNRIFFSSISIALILVILWFLKKAETYWERLAFVMIIGGALGNTLDRILLGSVTDFLDFDFPDFIMERWPIFNLADSSIVIAVFILLISTLFFSVKKDETNG